ncbi:MAG: HAD-IA family hydrolase [Thermodesulfovibrionales bacterium]
MKGIPLDEIDFVLLDLDGTLLDKYFDDYFWEHLVPEKYAEKHDMTFGRAREHLLRTYKGHEGTLNWTDLDFWSRELDLDVPALKEQVRHLIEVHPHVEEFLAEMRGRGKKVFLMTNAHYKSVNIKFKKTGIGKYFDTVVCSFEVGHPKEDLAFWERTERLLGYDRERTLFIDDTEEILRTARRFGIKHLLLKTGASSRDKAARASAEFPAISDFRQLLRGSR